VSASLKDNETPKINAYIDEKYCYINGPFGFADIKRIPKEPFLSRHRTKFCWLKSDLKGFNK
jgi:hypothetical protein